MEDLAMRMIATLGVPGLITFLAYKLLDKWFAQFLAVHDKQATAITDLAAAVKASQSGQNDVIMAVRVLSTKTDEAIGWMREIGEHIKGGISLVNMSEIEKQRHGRRKGDIIRILREDYLSRMTSVGSLIGALDMLGESISGESLQFDLTYLSQCGYIQIWAVRDMPGYRKDRPNMGSADEIRFAKLLPRGLQLLDGNIIEDPQVKF